MVYTKPQSRIETNNCNATTLLGGILGHLCLLFRWNYSVRETTFNPIAPSGHGLILRKGRNPNTYQAPAALTGYAKNPCAQGLGLQSTASKT